jgi:hypothetical protein
MTLRACGFVENQCRSMFETDAYITDSNHRYGFGLAPGELLINASGFSKAVTGDWSHKERRDAVGS